MVVGNFGCLFMAGGGGGGGGGTCVENEIAPVPAGMLMVDSVK